MRLTSALVAAFFGGSLGLTAAQWVPEAPGVRGVPHSAPAMHISGIEQAPAAGFVGDFNANVISFPPLEIELTTPKLRPPPRVECDPTVQNRPGGYLRRVCP